MAIIRALSALILTFVAVPLSAGQPDVLQSVLECRGIVDTGARLTCYDKTVGALSVAAENKDLVATDRSEREVRRQETFGLEKQPKAAGDGFELQSKITRVDFNPATAVAVVSLENGQVWRTNSNGTLVERLRAEQAVTITRSGALGFRLRIEGRSGFQGVVRIR